MAILFEDCGARAALKTIFLGVIPVNPKTYWLCLYTNDEAIPDTYTAANMREATGGGYARIELPMTSWTVPETGNIPTAVNTERLFIFTGPLTTYPDIRGYYVLDADGTLMFSEEEATPYTPENDGDVLAITPSFMLSKGTPT